MLTDACRFGTLRAEIQSSRRPYANPPTLTANADAPSHVVAREISHAVRTITAQRSRRDDERLQARWQSVGPRPAAAETFTARWARWPWPLESRLPPVESPAVGWGRTDLTAADVVIPTKLRSPPASESFVPRPALVRHLHELTRRRITILAAPTGFGKTTLLVQWLEAEERPVAWLSLDEADSDATRFWRYVLEALTAVEPGFGGVGPPSAASRPLESTIPRLLNRLDVLDRQIVLVLEDYHVLTAPFAHEDVAFFVRHLPETLRLVVSTRATPPLPLGRLRARGELGEIRSRDLRFDLSEIDELLRRSVCLPLDDTELRVLEERTEGWPAGCYLAALTLRDRPDRSTFLERFAGSNRHIVDYLGPEVLAGLPSDLTTFLLRSSILETLSGPICDAVLERSESGEMLRQLEDSNLFLVALDESRDCYRYHRLFADLLRFELEQNEPEALQGLHHRAAIASEASGAIYEAVSHAVAAGEAGLARELVVRHWFKLYRAGEIETVRLMLQRVGAAHIEEDAALALSAAWVDLMIGATEREVARWIRAVETSSPSGPYPLGTDSLELELAFVRAACLFGDAGAHLAAADELARLADDRLPAHAAGEGGRLVAAARAHALFFCGRWEESLAELDALEALPPASTPIVDAAAPAFRSLIEDRIGDAATAAAAAREAMNAAARYGLQETPSIGIVYVALGTALARNGELDEAEAMVEKGARLVERPEGNLAGIHAMLRLADVRAQQGDSQAARSLVDRARALIAACADPGMLRGLADEVERKLGKSREPAPTHELTEAELRVLRLYPTRLTHREIARELYISLNTVKTHANSIHRKLGVSSRREAVEAVRRVERDD